MLEIRKLLGISESGPEHPSVKRKWASITLLVVNEKSERKRCQKRALPVVSPLKRRPSEAVY